MGAAATLLYFLPSKCNIDANLVLSKLSSPPQVDLASVSELQLSVGSEVALDFEEENQKIAQNISILSVSSEVEEANQEGNDKTMVCLTSN